jgi:hypothetical protein
VVVEAQTVLDELHDRAIRTMDYPTLLFIHCN